MPAALIRIDQLTHATIPIGTAGRSRDDIELGEQVRLVNANDAGVRTHFWEIVAQPDMSAPVSLSNPLAPNPTFTPNVVGTYRVRLRVNEGRVGERDIRTVVVRDGDGNRFPAVGEEDESNWDDPDTGQPNERGWWDDLRRSIAGAGGGVGVTDGTTLVAGATTINLDPAFFEVANGGGGIADVTMNPDEVGVDVTDGTTTVPNATALVLDPTFFAVANGGGGDADLTMADGPETSVLAVVQGAGAPEYLPATDNNQALLRIDGELVFETISTNFVDPTYADIDLTAEATTALANGAFPIGGLPFIADDSALAGAGSGLVNGVGLSLRAPTSSANTWTVTSQAAPHLYMDVSNIEGFLPGVHTLVIDMHLGAATVFEQGNDAIRMGLWALINTPFTGAAARARIADRGNHGGVQTLRTFDGTTVGSTAVDVSSFNAYSVIIPPAGDMVLGVGTYSGGWPASFTYFWRFSTTLATDSMLGGNGMRFALIFINSSDASPTSRADVAHLRFRKAV